MIRVRRKVRLLGSDETWTDAIERTLGGLKRGWHVVKVDRTHSDDDRDPHVAIIVGEDIGEDRDT